MIGVIYARYSSESQRDESIDGQIRECMAFAERQGITYWIPTLTGRYPQRQIIDHSSKK